MAWTDRRSEPEDTEPLDDATEMALRDGLRAQPAPTVSAGFDERVMASVRRRSPLRDVLFSALRPAIATAAVSTAVTTLMIGLPNRPNPAIAASHPPAATASAASAQRVREAVAEGSYVGFEPLRGGIPHRQAYRQRLPGG